HHDVEALRVDLRLLLRDAQPGAPGVGPPEPPRGLAGRRLDGHGRDDRGRRLRLPSVHGVRPAGRPAGDLPGRLRGGARRRGVGVADVPVGDAAAAAARPPGGRRAEHRLRLQLVPDRVDAQRPQPGLRPRHDDHLHVQDRLQELAARRRARGGPGRGQRALDPARRGRLSAHGALARGGAVMRGTGRAGLGLAGLLVTLLVLSPYLVMLLTALKPAAELRKSPPSLTPVLWHWESFAGVLRDADFLTWLRGSLLVACASPAIVLLAAVPAAYYTARHRFPGRQAFLFLVLVTQMFSPTALVVGLHREFFELDLINTYAALILTNAAFNLAFAVWILRAFFASIPREIEEAAAVDGRGTLGTLLRVVLPLARPALVTAAIFAFIAAWNEYIVALTLMT